MKYNVNNKNSNKDLFNKIESFIDDLFTQKGYSVEIHFLLTRISQMFIYHNKDTKKKFLSLQDKLSIVNYILNKYVKQDKAEITSTNIKNNLLMTVTVI